MVAEEDAAAFEALQSAVAAAVEIVAGAQLSPYASPFSTSDD